MPPVSLDALRTPANGQVFGLDRPLSKAAIEEALATASQESSGRRLGKTVREKGTVNGQNYWASFICFPLARPPSFLPQADLTESTYGFVLLLELELAHEWFLGLFRHDIGSLADWLSVRTKALSRRKFTNAFSESAAVRRLSLQRMTASKHELRAASYEATDLQSSLPMMAASRCVIRSISFQDSASGSIGVTVSTSRVQQSGGRRAVDDLARMVTLVAREIQADKQDAFLSSFSQAVALTDLPADVEPTSVLFDWGPILENDSLELYRRPDDEGSPTREVRKTLLLRLLDGALPMTSDGDGWTCGPEPNVPRARFALTSTRYSVKSILRNRLVLRDTRTGSVTPLARWVRENDAYSITFSQPEFFFSDGALYQRASFAQEIEVVRRCLHPSEELEAATSEKGVPQANDTSFAHDSIFGIVDSALYAQRDWLCCNDLGDEWADFLCVRGHSLVFMHCKHGDPTSGASRFQDVVGQALKNLGRIQSTPSAFTDKLTAIEASGTWGNTQIDRLREAGQWPQFRAAVERLLADPDASREVHLVVTMLSKAAFDIEAQAPTPHFVQQVWLLSAFANSCREMGGRPSIVCRP